MLVIVKSTWCHQDVELLWESMKHEVQGEYCCQMRPLLCIDWIYGFKWPWLWPEIPKFHTRPTYMHSWSLNERIQRTLIGFTDQSMITLGWNLLSSSLTWMLLFFNHQCNFKHHAFFPHLRLLLCFVLLVSLFFSEMAEHHNIKQILTLARDLVCKVQMLIENKWSYCLFVVIASKWSAVVAVQTWVHMDISVLWHYNTHRERHTHIQFLQSKFCWALMTVWPMLSLVDNINISRHVCVPSHQTKSVTVNVWLGLAAVNPVSFNWTHHEWGQNIECWY